MNINMISVEGGTFQFGNKVSVTVSNFKIGKYPVTQKQWVEIMGTNPSHFSGDSLPVENVSWEDVQAFLTKLNTIDPNKNYRLPTEAEWEYAARGGRLSKGYMYAGSNDLDEVGWYWKNSGGKTHPVGSKKPNELGIYDMSGNVWEWCQDWFGDYPDEAQENYSDPQTGIYRVLRGGSWNNNDNYCRSAIRDGFYPDFRNGYYGFRLAM
jgi:formylglycine-generating enzyme required for sulfatase activity